MEDGRLQSVRELMRGFASEIVLQTASLPLATYPAALLAAAAELEDGRPEIAVDILGRTLHGGDRGGRHPPAPLRAEAVLPEAEALLTEPDRTEEEQDRLEALLEVAREQVGMGQTLGYGTEDDHDAVLDEIGRVEDEARETPIERGFAQLREGLSGISDRGLRAGPSAPPASMPKSIP